MSVALALALALAAMLQAPAPRTPAPRRHPVPKPAPPPVFEGTVRGPDGRPVADALVVAKPVTDRLDDRPLSTRSDEKGRFRIASARPGPHHLHVQATGLAAWKGERIRPGTPLLVTLEKGLAIEGTVRDGGSAAPVAHARVSASVGERLDWEPESGVVTALTDAKGRYRLAGVPLGLHVVSARAPGYALARRPAVRAGGTADFVLFPGASVFGTVSGPDGTPVERAVVRLEGEERWWGGWLPAERTDAAGGFELLGVRPGSYTLVARHPDFAPGVSPGVTVERGVDARADVALARGATLTGRLLDADDAPLAGRVLVQELNGRPVSHALAELLRAEAGPDGRFRLEKVPPGDHALAARAPTHAPARVEFDVGARSPTVDVGDVRLEPGLAIRGSVRDRAGNGLADASVTGFQRMARGAAGAQVETVSGPEGRFVLAGLVQATYSLSVQASGYGRAHRTVAPGADEVAFVLDAAGAIAGVVVDESGRPLDAYRVEARPVAEDQYPHMTEVGSADGRFRLEEVAQGGYVVQITAPGRAPATRSDVLVTPGSVADVGRVRLARGGTVRGAVTDMAGAPVPGATISIRRSLRDYSGFGEDALEVVTDSGGTFEATGVPAGTAVAVATHPDYAPGESAPIVVDPAGGAAEARIVVSQGGRIEGSARKRDGSPILPAQVRAMAHGPWPEQSAELRPDGGFAIEHVPAGRTWVTLMQREHGRMSGGQRREVEVRDGETALVEFVQRDILVSGVVRRAGVPAAGLRVSLFGHRAFVSYGAAPLAVAPPPPSGPQRMTAVTREDGSFELLADEPGQARVMVESVDGRLSLPQRTVEIPDADSFALDLDFAGATVSVLVADKQTGQPIAEANLFVQAQEPGGSGHGGRAVSGADGRAVLELEDGEYRLNAWAEGYAAGAARIQVPGSAETTLALSRGAVLKGRVVDAVGRGVPGLDVTAFAGDPSDWSGQAWIATLPDGVFQFEPLLPRPYNVFAGSAQTGFGLVVGALPGQSPVTVRLRPPGLVQLRVYGPDGAPAADARAGVREVDGVKVMAHLELPPTDAQGLAELVLPAGRVLIKVWQEALEGRVTVDVPSGGGATAEVTLAVAPPDGPS